MAAAEHAAKFFDKYQFHIEGELAGQPFILEDWQRKDMIWPLFGWKRPDGSRRYREGYLEIPRKNGKSTLSAGAGNYLTFADGEPAAQVYAGAVNGEQAEIVFNMAKGMVKASPELAKRAWCGSKVIKVRKTNSIFRPLTSKAASKHGKNASGNIIDELHVHPTRHLYDVMKTGTAGRRQPLTLSITTAGWDRNSICWELHDYATKVLKFRAGDAESGIEDDSFFALIFAADEKDDWTLEKTWRKANPNLGVSVSLDYLRDECRKAQEMPAYENTFRQLHLNQWTSQAVRWMPMRHWDRCGDPIDWGEFAGKVCTAGLDLASTTDIAALVLNFREGPVMSWKGYFWIPEERMKERIRRDRVPYDMWVKSGFVKTTPGNVIDYRVIREDILKIRDKYKILEVAYDSWAATQIVQELIDEGMEMVPVSMNYSALSAPTKELLTKAMQRHLRHGGNPVLRWMAENVVVKKDPMDRIRPDKAKSTSRIDGIVAGIMAMDRSIRNLAGIGSVYDERGFLSS